MIFGIQSFCGRRLPARHRVWFVWDILFVVLGRLVLLPALGDGCFVFQWNKSIDINEPTQKAIIVYDGGREDLLLQVKYEGPLEEFGWLIPVPSLPTVEKGSMGPFYELSQLTQQQWGIRHGVMSGSAGIKGAEGETVKVIELKTVGAYEVAVLSAQEAGSLERWLKAHGYTIPGGQTGIVDEYIHKGWYFIAAKINLSKPVALQKAAGATAKNTKASAQARNTIRKQLSSGELHPLLITFDTPKCIYPLRISAVSGKPSEVSLYVLSAQPLLDPFIFSTDLGRLRQRGTEWEKERPERIKNRAQCEQNVRVMQVSLQVSEFRARGERRGQRERDWSLEDLIAISKEGQPPASPSELDDGFYTSPSELLHCQRVTPDQIPQCIKTLPRLKARNWYLTKQVRTFRPQEMHDLEFQPAIPVLVAVLPDPAGGAAATLLTALDPKLHSVLVTACQSTNALQRINASSGLQGVADPSLVRPLLALLKDDAPRVRLNAVEAAFPNWDPRLVEPLVALFRDPHPEIRQAATQCLVRRESTNRASAYLALLRDPDPDVQVCALRVLLQIGRKAIPRTELLRLLGSSRIETVFPALGLLKGEQSWGLIYQPPITYPALPGASRNQSAFLRRSRAAYDQPSDCSTHHGAENPAQERRFPSCHINFAAYCATPIRSSATAPLPYSTN